MLHTVLNWFALGMGFWLTCYLINRVYLWFKGTLSGFV